MSERISEASDMSEVGEVVATLPAGLDMSEADQERPRARQAAEMQRSDSRRLRRELRRMVQEDGWSPRTVHDFLYLLGLTSTCNIAWSALMYLRIVKRSDLSWLHVMAPLIASSVLCAAFVLHQVWQRRAVAAHRWRTQYGPVRPATLFVENLGNIGTLWLLAGHLERDAPASVQVAIYPTIAAEALSLLVSAALFRPLEERDGEEVAVPGARVVQQKLGPKLIAVMAYLSIAARCDGADGTWVSALWGVWLVLAFLGCGVLSSLLIVVFSEIEPALKLLGAAAVCCCLAPLVVLGAVFFIFLAQDLDGAQARSDETLVGLMVALQVVASALTFALFYQMDRFVQQQEAEARVMADLAEHNDAEAGGAGGADARAAEIDARVREQQKRLKLVRESSTLFRRLASSGAGFDLEQPPSSPPALERAASSRDAMECAICYENARDAFVQPCGHGGFCYTCGKTLLATRAKCPLCRTPIEEVLLIDASATRRDEQGRVVVETEKSAMTRPYVGPIRVEMS